MGRRRMIEPWKNPRSKVWWFRRRVPARYRLLGLPAEIKFSLETKDWDEADDLCRSINLDLERGWKANLANLQKPSDELSHLQITALAGEFYRDTIAANRENPGSAETWERKLRAIEEVKHRRFLPPGAWLPIVFEGEARAFLEKKGVKLGGKKFVSFLDGFLTAKREASEELVRNANKDYTENKKVADRFPTFEPPKPEQKFEKLWAEFVAAKGLAASTIKKWKPYFAKLIERVGTDDMNRVTEQNLLDWRDELLAAGVSQTNVKYGYVAATRAFFRWAKEQKKLTTNPGAEVFVTVPKKKKSKMRGFNDREAATILAGALAPPNEKMTAENAAARRWVPWLCAYTGARVNEMTQARAGDVFEEDGIKCIRITPEAGTVKTEERVVPLHPHLVEMGFFEWAKGKRDTTPLFYSVARQRKKDRKNPTYTSVGNKLRDWVRNRLKITDPKVAPNHGWRHRFKDIGLEADMKERVLDAIQGHAPRTEGEKYGRPKLAVMLREIEKHPWYDVVAPTEPVDRRLRGQRRTAAAANS